MNKESVVSSADKELAAEAEEEGTGALHLRLALEGSKSKNLGRPSSFKRGKDVGPVLYFLQISTS